MKFFISLVMFFLFLNCFSTAQTLIPDSCKKASAQDPLFKYDFCVQSLENDPQSKTATSLEELLIASTKNAASNTTNVKGIVQEFINDKKFIPGTEIPLRDCINFYDDANVSFDKALTYVKSGDYSSVNVHLSTALDDTTNCEDGFKEKHQNSPITNENDVLYQQILIPLAFSTIF